MLPPKCRELRACELLEEWVKTLSEDERLVVLQKVEDFLEGNHFGVGVLWDCVAEIRITEPAVIFVYIYFDVAHQKFRFMSGSKRL